VPGQNRSGAVVAAQLAQLGEVGGGEEGGNAQGAGIAGGDDASACLAPCQDKGAEMSVRDGRLIADGDDDGVAVSRCIEAGDQGAGHAGSGAPVLGHAQWQTVEQRAVLGRAWPEHDDGHVEAGVEQHACSPGEHGDLADEGGLLICTEAVAAAGSQQDAGDAAQVDSEACTGHIANIAGRAPPTPK
jgi:hypothetical protein